MKPITTTNMKTLTFSNGDQIPILGLGTWKSNPGEVFQAVLWAIAAGYRHIDCAAVYNNEKEVGRALEKAILEGMVKREELFITSKLWNNSHRKEDVKPAIKNSLKDLRLDYLDLYLVHWPVSFKPKVGLAKTREEFYTYRDVPLAQTWAGMEEVQKTGLTNHIGMSNFNISKLEEILNHCSFRPEMNQVELHPFLPQNKLVGYCHSQNILVTAYAPLGSGDRMSSLKSQNEPSLSENHTVKSIADKHAATPEQVLIAWSISRDVVVIPKSVNENRIQENFEAVQIKLDEQDLIQLSEIKQVFRFLDGKVFTGKQSPYTPADLWEVEG